MLRIVIIGYGEMFTNLIAGALDAKVKIVGVLENETIKYHPIIKKLKNIINPASDYNYIKSYDIPTIKGIKSVNSKEFKKELIKLNPDIILVGSWGEKFSKEIYSIPKIATINVHPSLLPKYRGPNPYFWTIRNQEKVSGVTFHLMDENYDTGAILAQEEVPVLENDTGKSLKQRTVLKARAVVCELLKSLQEDVIIPLQQREDKASYYSYPKDLELDFNKSAEENYALIRAAYPWLNTYFYYKNEAFRVNFANVSINENTTTYTRAGTVVNKDLKTNTLSIVCADGKVLKISKLTLWNPIKKFFTSYFIK